MAPAMPRTMSPRGTRRDSLSQRTSRAFDTEDEADKRQRDEGDLHDIERDARYLPAGDGNPTDTHRHEDEHRADPKHRAPGRYRPDDAAQDRAERRCRAQDESAHTHQCTDFRARRTRQDDREHQGSDDACAHSLNKATSQQDRVRGREGRNQRAGQDRAGGREEQ